MDIICLGYDYGTTNSLMEKFDNEEFLPLARSSSSYIYDTQVILSPKRLLRKIEFDNENEPVILADVHLPVPIDKVLTEFTENNILSNCELPKGKTIHLTLTIPDTYSNYECKLMEDAVCSAMTNSFGDLFDIEKDISIIAEPVAATLYYTYQHLNELSEENGPIDILTCDVGGGTTDLALVRVYVKKNTNRTDGLHTYAISFNVLGTAGDDNLGGNDVNDVMIAKFSEQKSLKTIDRNSLWLWEACESLKIMLSDINQPEAEIRTIYAKNTKGEKIKRSGQPLSFSCSRQQLEDWVTNYFWENNGPKNKLKDCITNVISAAERKLSQINKKLKKEKIEMPGINKNKLIILPVGGGMRMPMFRDTLHGEFPATVKLADFKVKDDDFDCVARGAALYSAYMTDQLTTIEEIKIENRTSYSISVKHSENQVMECVPRNVKTGEYTAILKPLIIDEVQGTFELTDLEFFQSAHKTQLVQDTKPMGKLRIGKNRVFEVKNGNPADAVLVLSFYVTADLREVQVQLRIDDVRAYKSSKDFETITIPEGNKWQRIKL